MGLEIIFSIIRLKKWSGLLKYSDLTYFKRILTKNFA